MRQKRPALVITFPTTVAAMGCETLCIERGLPGRTIPRTRGGRCRLRSGVEGVACR